MGPVVLFGKVYHVVESLVEFLELILVPAYGLFEFVWESFDNVRGECSRIPCRKAWVCGVLHVVVEQADFCGVSSECRVVWEFGVAKLGVELVRPVRLCILFKELCAKSWPLNGHGTRLSICGLGSLVEELDGPDVRCALHEEQREL